MRYVFCLFTLTLTFLNVLVQPTDAEREVEIASVDVIYSAAIAPDGKYFALGQIGAVSLEADESETRRILIEDDNATVNTLAFSQGVQPRMLALGTSTGAVYLYDVTTKLQKADLLGKHNWGIVGITLTANGKLVVSASENGNIKFWNVQTKQEIFSLDDFHKFEAPGNVTAVALSPDGTTLALGTTLGASPTEGTLQLREISRESLSPHPKRKINIPERTYIKTLAFSPDNKMLAAGAGDGTLFLLELPKRVSRLTTINKSRFAVTTLTFSPDSQMVVVGTENGDISFWDPYTSVKKKGITPVDTDRSQHSTEVLSVAFSDDGNILTSIDTTRATLSWNLPISSKTSVVEKSSEKKPVTTVVKPKVPENTGRVPSTVKLAQVEIVSPKPDANNSIKTWTGRLTVRARVVHETGIETVTIGGITTEEMSPVQEGVDLFTGRISFREYGTHTFNIVAIPKNGRRTVRRVAVNFTKDEIDPQITISKLTDKSVSGRVTDKESGVNLSTVKIGNQKIPLEADGSFTYTPTLQEGDNSFMITASDKAGNHANSEFVIHRPTQSSRATAVLTPPTNTVQKPSSTVETPVPKTTPVSELETPEEQTTTRYTTAPDTSTAPLNTAPIQRDEDDPRITFINHELHKERFYRTMENSFLLEVYVLDESRIPTEGVKIERKAGGVDSRTYAFIANAVKRGEKYVVTIPLDPGTNEFRIAAEDEWFNIERQSFTIVRARADMEGPRIEVTQVGDQTIRFPGEVVIVSGEEIRVRGRVDDRSGIRSVTVNGIATLIDNGSFETNVPLDYAENTITIRATDQRKHISETMFRVYQRPNRVDKDFAIFFPTDTYSGVKDDNGNWLNLQSTIRDAEVIEANLRDNYGFETRIFKNCTAKDLLSTIYTYRNDFEGIKYTPGSQLLIFFSGHGYYDEETEIGYLITADTDCIEVDPGQASAIDHRTLRTLIDAITCDRLLVLLDTCSSGPFDPDFEPLPELRIRSLRDDSLLQQVNTKLMLDARWCLTAAGVEYALDGGNEGNSPFAKAFLNALNTKGGDDSLLNLDEVWSEVHKSREAPIYQIFMEGGKIQDFPEPRKGQFGKRSFNESDFLFFPVR